MFEFLTLIFVSRNLTFNNKLAVEIALHTNIVYFHYQESDDVINPAAFNGELLRQVRDSNASAPAMAEEIKKRGNELKKFILLPLMRHKEKQGHHRNQSPTKHHEEHHHQHQHISPSAGIHLPRPSPTFPFNTRTDEHVDFSTEEYAQITPTPSVDSWLTRLIFTPKLRYARADKVPDDSQVKIAKISSLNSSPTPTFTPVSSVMTLSMQPNQSVTGILKYCALVTRVIVALEVRMFRL